MIVIRHSFIDPEKKDWVIKYDIIKCQKLKSFGHDNDGCWSVIFSTEEPKKGWSVPENGNLDIFYVDFDSF